MPKYLVLAMDGTRARILSLEPCEDPRAAARLVERLDLVNAEHQIEPHHRFTGQRSESRGHAFGHWYGMDDHRLGQDEEHERRFAGLAAGETLRIARNIGATDLTIIASPKMLGLIRSEGPRLFRFGLVVREDPSNVAGFPVQRLQEHLERKGHLPLRAVERQEA